MRNIFIKAKTIEGAEDKIEAIRITSLNIGDKVKVELPCGSSLIYEFKGAWDCEATEDLIIPIG